MNELNICVDTEKQIYFFIEFLLKNGVNNYIGFYTGLNFKINTMIKREPYLLNVSVKSKFIYSILKKELRKHFN